MGIDPNSERARRVAAAAQRLRAVQAELAGYPAPERRALIRDELDAALRALDPAERGAFLLELTEAFPAAPEGGAQTGADAATLDALASARAETARFNDPSSTAERLAAMAPRMTEDQRRAVIRRLAAAGLTEARAAEAAGPEPVRPAPEASAADLRKALGLTEADAIDAGRAGELCAVLAEFGGGLDELVWTAWRQAIAPSSRISRPGPLKRTMGQFVRGEAAITRQRLAEDVKLLRLITAATIAATSRAGKNYARKHLMKFSPDAIKGATGASGWGAQAKYWAKYEELAGVETEDAIESEIMQTIGEAARGLAEGKDVPR